MQSRMHHDKMKITMGQSEHDVFALIGKRETSVANPLRSLRHVRQNPDLGRAQLASLLRASRRNTDSQDATPKSWATLMGGMQSHRAND